MRAAQVRGVEVVGESGDIAVSLVEGDAVAGGKVLGDVVRIVALEQGMQHVGAGAVELPVAPGTFVEQDQAVVGISGDDVRAQSQ
jgi:hypothetical protein